MLITHSLEFIYLTFLTSCHCCKYKHRIRFTAWLSNSPKLFIYYILDKCIYPPVLSTLNRAIALLEASICSLQVCIDKPFCSRLTLLSAVQSGIRFILTQHFLCCLEASYWQEKDIPGSSAVYSLRCFSVRAQYCAV